MLIVEYENKRYTLSPRYVVREGELYINAYGEPCPAPTNHTVKDLTYHVLVPIEQW